MNQPRTSDSSSIGNPNPGSFGFGNVPVGSAIVTRLEGHVTVNGERIAPLADDALEAAITWLPHGHRR